MKEINSRLPGFYQKSVVERQKIVVDLCGFDEDEISQKLTIGQANQMIEGVIGLFSLPLGVATNFRINGSDYLIPMATEEPSVVAAASHAAKLLRGGNGIITEVQGVIVKAEARMKLEDSLIGQRILEASVFAEVDPYRAATHNKGIMNGIDAVTLATGNDWRETEAIIHSFAVQNGKYTSLSKWRVEEGFLVGEMCIPISILDLNMEDNPTAQVSMKILGNPSPLELNEIVAAVGLAQNFAALKALTTDGIQKGHMRLHRRKEEL